MMAFPAIPGLPILITGEDEYDIGFGVCFLTKLRK
jgi:hypothetical protein